MNILVMGAGAIGSLFGGLLSKKNTVLLIGRTPHVQAIKENGLHISGKTTMSVKIPAEDAINNVAFSPDLLILTVKSYDAASAMSQAKPIISNKTVVMSLQNGLDNINKIGKIVDPEQVIVGVTTHGVVFSKPGAIGHTGIGETILGELNGKKTERIAHIARLFTKAGIDTKVSTDIVRELWVKAIVNSSINPLTTFFQCKNGYLLQNPILEDIVEKTCRESTMVANEEGIPLSHKDMWKKTSQVIQDTADNYSSMLQSFRKGRKTEIASINGKIVEFGKRHGLDISMNEMLVYLVKQASEK